MLIFASDAVKPVQPLPQRETLTLLLWPADEDLCSRQRHYLYLSGWFTLQTAFKNISGTKAICAFACKKFKNRKDPQKIVSQKVAL